MTTDDQIEPGGEPSPEQRAVMSLEDIVFLLDTGQGELADCTTQIERTGLGHHYRLTIEVIVRHRTKADLLAEAYDKVDFDVMRKLAP